MTLQNESNAMNFTPAKLLTLIAVICFVLAAFGVHVAEINLTDVGLAFGFAAFLV